MKFLIAIFLGYFFFLGNNAYSQTNDSTLDNDTLRKDTVGFLHPSLIQDYLQLGNYKSFLLENKKPIVFDVQQFHSINSNLLILIIMMLLLAILTYVKVAFAKDLEELLQSFVNANIAQQIFRAQSKEISFSSFLLLSNFFIALSLYIQFIFANNFHVTSFKSNSSIIILLFLFTFFYALKVAVLKSIGMIFDVNEECNEYLYNFSIICKIAGLTLIPALFILETTQGKFSNLIFVTSILLFITFVVIFIWRGLSTGYKLMYKSIYHFFIYVCVVEISPIFLLFKLLTKTIM